MITTKDGPLYQTWRVYGFYKSDPETYVLGESEMIGNILNQVGKGLEQGYDVITIGKTDKYVDGRVPCS